jgi:hypothetical protein
MGCHIIDTAYWALDLGLPISVEMEGSPRVPESGPKVQSRDLRVPRTRQPAAREALLV